jgi:hypothetical protein
LTGPPRFRAVSLARAQKMAGVQIRSPPAPDDHLIASPDCRVPGSCGGCIVGARSYPAIHARIISHAGIQSASVTKASPNDHLASGPHCYVMAARGRRASGASRCPIVGIRVVSSTSVHRNRTPNNHFIARPNRCVLFPCLRHVCSARGCPIVGSWIVPPAGVQNTDELITDHPPSPKATPKIFASRRRGKL